MSHLQVSERSSRIRALHRPFASSLQLITIIKTTFVEPLFLQPSPSPVHRMVFCDSGSLLVSTIYSLRFIDLNSDTWTLLRLPSLAGYWNSMDYKLTFASWSGMETPVQPDFRVIRGPDWSYKNQDGGKGHAGTVRRLRDVHRPHFPPNSVLVQWDNGDKGLYRVGYDQAFDLRILETANSVCHTKVWCDGCNADEIRGIRWRCTECYAIDLCTTCYMNDEHDLSHVFMRVLSSHKTSMGPKMLPRSSSPRVALRGSFPGAKVVRYPQGYRRLGSDKQLGKVVSSEKTPEDKAKVQVAVEFSTLEERVHFTKIVCTLPGSGGCVYEGHLPILGDLERVNEGDKVLVTATPEELEKLHKRRGTWKPDMVKTFRRKGFVNRRTNSGDFEVTFSDTQETYIMNSAALRKIHRLCLGQLVRISDDMEMVKRLQFGHGGWASNMKKVIGKVGKVVNIDGSDIHVKTKDNHKFIFNTANLTPTTFHVCARQEGGMAEAFCGLRKKTELEVNITLAAASGDIGALERIFNKNPDWANYEPQPGRTLMHNAAVEGDVRMLKFLVEKGAFIETFDEIGATPLIHATCANKPENVKYLLEQGADVNATNHQDSTSFSLASTKGFFQCAQYLLMNGSDINHKGEKAVTAAMVSPDSGLQNMVDFIMDRKEADLKAVSTSLVSIMHGTATIDNSYAITKLLGKVPRLVEARDEWGRTPLFHAVFKGSRNVAELLIKKGHCDVNALENLSEMSPLDAALIHCQFQLVEVLVKNGADPNILRRSGNTSLQVALNIIEHAQENSKYIKEEPYMAEMKKKWGHLGIKTNGDALVAYLVSHGANLDAYNAGGITIRHMLSMTHPSLLHALAEIQAQRGKDIARQQSTANRPLRLVTKKTDGNESGGNSLSTLLKKSTSKSESKKQSSGSSSRLVGSTNSGSQKKVSGKESTDVKQIGAARPGVKDSCTGDLHQLQAELRRKDEELETLRSRVKTLEHLVKKKIVFACGHDVIRSIAELIPECPNCSEPITSVVDLK